MRREEKKRATRDLLMQTALDLFAEQGYEATTVDQVTRTAGVAKGTFFNYFQSKEDVLLQIGDAQQSWAAAQAAELAHESGPLAPHLIDLMVRLATRLHFTRPLVRALFQASLRSPERLSGQVSQVLAFAGALTPVFALGQARGEFTRRFPAEVLAGLAIQTYFGVLQTWAFGSADEPLGPRMAASFDALFYGVCVRGEEEQNEHAAGTRI